MTRQVFEGLGEMVRRELAGGAAAKKPAAGAAGSKKRRAPEGPKAGGGGKRSKKAAAAAAAAAVSDDEDEEGEESEDLSPGSEAEGVSTPLRHNMIPALPSTRFVPPSQEAIEPLAPREQRRAGLRTLPNKSQPAVGAASPSPSPAGKGRRKE